MTLRTTSSSWALAIVHAIEEGGIDCRALFAELGLDYVKIHPSLVQGIAENEGNQEFVKRFCGVAHTVGIIVIAVGVRTEEDLAKLKDLGVDGATGPVVQA